MAEPASRIPHPRLEVPLLEAQTHFVQLARLASLSQQSTLVTDGGRPLAVIVPFDTAASSARSDRSAAGWLRRIENLRAEFQRQHDAVTDALDLAWRELDRLSPPGVDSRIDVLRLAHADLRRPR
jgi:antitoxin (DNA-binding transcriptional repressor) of toxin-antitoxin stability system